MEALRGTRALVTGGTSGIGAAIVDRFRAEGATVVFTGRDETRGQESRTGPARRSCGRTSARRTTFRLGAEGRRLARGPRCARGQRRRPARGAALRDLRRGLGRGHRDEPGRALPLCGRLPARAPGRGRRLDRDVSSDAGVWAETTIGAYSVSKRALNMLVQMLAVEAGPTGSASTRSAPATRRPGWPRSSPVGSSRAIRPAGSCRRSGGSARERTSRRRSPSSSRRTRRSATARCCWSTAACAPPCTRAPS